MKTVAENLVKSLSLNQDSTFDIMDRLETQEWSAMYLSGCSTPNIAKKYGVGSSTVRRHLISSGVQLRNRVEASVIASTRYPRHPFSGDPAEAAYLSGFIEDCHVRQRGRLLEVGTTTTHPAMETLFWTVFGRYGHIYRHASFDHANSYYRYQLASYLESDFAYVLGKGFDVPLHVPRDPKSPLLKHYLAGLIDAEGGIRTYNDGGRAASVLHITIQKYRLLATLRRVFGGRLYSHDRAWRLVFYGRRADDLLGQLALRHAEKIEKSDFVRRVAGVTWGKVEGDWIRIVHGIHEAVRRYKEDARAEYLRIHGRPHVKDRLSGV